MNTQTLTKELKKSFFIRMKIPTDQVDAFVERILSLPEDQKKKALEIVKKAEQAFASLVEEETRNAQSFAVSLGNL